MILGGCLLVAAAAAAIIEGYASDAQQRGGNLALAFTLFVVAVLAIIVGFIGYVRSPHRTEGIVAQGDEPNSASPSEK